MKEPIRLSLTDSSIRKEFKDRVRFLRSRTAASQLDEIATAFAALDEWFQPIAEGDLKRLLMQALAWDESEHRLAHRLHESAARLAEYGRQAALTCAGGMPQSDPRALEVLSRATHLWSLAAKLEHIAIVDAAHRQRFSDLHKIYEAAARRGAGLTRHFGVHGQSIEASIESLFVRALLLRRLCSGNLNARQIEVLDSWLLSWLPSLWITREPPAGEVTMRVQLGTNSGLVQGPTKDHADARYVSVAALRQQLDRVVASLHVGDLFPGWGPAVEFRVEDHIAVLDTLQRELAQMESGETARRTHRAQRTPAFGMQIDTHVGLLHVMSGAFDPLHRGIRMRLQDHNESGVGVLVDSDDGTRIHAGDLIALHLDPTQPAFIGEVVRKRAVASQADVLLGVRLLSREAVPVMLAHPGEEEPEQALFFPGEDNCGRGDALVVSEALFRSQKVLRTEDDGEVFRLRLNRVRHKGRGWVLAGFELVVENEAASAFPTELSLAQG